MKIVLDTNVLVSGLLSPLGPPATILRLVAVGELRLCFDGRILAEYRKVLSRARFGFDPRDVDDLLDQVEGGGELVAAGPLAARLPHPADEPFLEVAAAARADALVTGNLRHFPEDRRAGVTVVNPAGLLDMLR